MCPSSHLTGSSVLNAVTSAIKAALRPLSMVTSCASTSSEAHRPEGQCVEMCCARTVAWFAWHGEACHYFVFASSAAGNWHQGGLRPGRGDCDCYDCAHCPGPTKLVRRTGSLQMAPWLAVTAEGTPTGGIVDATLADGIFVEQLKQRQQMAP